MTTIHLEVFDPVTPEPPSLSLDDAYTYAIQNPAQLFIWIED